MLKILPAFIGFKSLINVSKATPQLVNRAYILSKKMSNTSSSTTHEDSLVWEASVPNESWTEKTRKLYDDLMDQCKDGEWEKVISFQNFSAKERLFVRAVEEKGKMFEYAMFLNRKEERIKAVMQFGPWLQGPKGAVHGGAIATMFDSISGVLTYQLGYRCVTANLNVNFHGMLPLLETAICESWVAKKEGRKIYVEAKLQSVDGQTVYDTCNLLWIDLNAHSRPHRDEHAESKY